MEAEVFGAYEVAAETNDGVGSALGEAGLREVPDEDTVGEVSVRTHEADDEPSGTENALHTMEEMGHEKVRRGWALHDAGERDECEGSVRT